MKKREIPKYLQNELSKVKEIRDSYLEFYDIDLDTFLSSSREAWLVLHRKSLLLILKSRGYLESLICKAFNRCRTTLIYQYRCLRELKEFDIKFNTHSKEFILAEDYEKSI